MREPLTFCRSACACECAQRCRCSPARKGLDLNTTALLAPCMQVDGAPPSLAQEGAIQWRAGEPFRCGPAHLHAAHCILALAPAVFIQLPYSAPARWLHHVRCSCLGSSSAHVGWLCAMLSCTHHPLLSAAAVLLALQLGEWTPGVRATTAGTHNRSHTHTHPAYYTPLTGCREGSAQQPSWRPTRLGPMHGRALRAVRPANSWSSVCGGGEARSQVRECACEQVWLLMRALVVCWRASMPRRAVTVKQERRAPGAAA